MAPAIGVLLAGILLSLYFTSEKSLSATAKRVEGPDQYRGSAAGMPVAWPS